MEGVQLITSCSKRKTLDPPERLRLGSISAKRTLGQLASAWLRRLESNSVAKVSARDLYSGNHWASVRSIAESSNAPVRVWVCSAGYGLVGIDSELAPYSATFSPGEDDSIRLRDTRPTPQHAKNWWERLGQWEGPSPTKPRTLEALVGESPDSFVLVAMSEVYLRAVADDLVAAVAKLGDPNRLAILSAGTSRVPGLQQHLLPSDARLETKVGGARVSLNARLAAALLESIPRPRLSLASCRKTLEKWLAGLPKARNLARKKMSDDDVLAFLASARSKQPDASASRLLRELRGQGKACEQSRFRRLYLQTKDD